jgi:hypothetical protein
MALFCKSTYLTHKIREKQVLCQNFIRFLFFCSHFSDIFRIFAFAIGKPTTQKSKNECKNKYLMAKIIVRNQTKKTLTKDGVDYICITDIARQKNPIEPKDVVKNWLRSKNTLEYLGL